MFAALFIAFCMISAVPLAANIKKVEEERDGKGVVFEKASFLADMKPNMFQMMDTLPPVPVFNNLTEGNKWLQAQRQTVTDNISKYDAGLLAMSNQSKSTKTSLEQAMAMPGLSGQQINNLQVIFDSRGFLLATSSIEAAITCKLLIC